MPLPEPYETSYRVPPHPYELPYKIWELIAPAFADDGITLTESFPHTALSSPVIVWRMVERYPGKEGRERLKPRLRLSKFTLDGNYVVEYWGQWNTCVYEFSVVDRDMLDSYRILSRLEDAIFFAIPDIKMRYGVDEFLFVNSTTPYILNVREEQLCVTSITYRAAIERVHRTVAPTISRFQYRPYAGATRAVDVPIVRSSQEYDQLPHPRVVMVEAAFDSPHLSDSLQKMVDPNTEWPDEWEPYISGVDFVVTRDSQETCYVHWQRGRRSPEVGATYYITYWYTT